VEEIFIPALGMAMEEATLTEWVKQPGDVIAAGDVIALVETDKVILDVQAETAGVLGPHLFSSGAVLPVGTVITHVLPG